MHHLIGSLGSGLIAATRCGKKVAPRERQRRPPDVGPADAAIKFGLQKALRSPLGCASYDIRTGKREARESPFRIVGRGAWLCFEARTDQLQAAASWQRTSGTARRAPGAFCLAVVSSQTQAMAPEPRPIPVQRLRARPRVPRKTASRTERARFVHSVRTTTDLGRRLLQRWLRRRLTLVQRILCVVIAAREQPRPPICCPCRQTPRRVVDRIRRRPDG